MAPEVEQNWQACVVPLVTIWSTGAPALWPITGGDVVQIPRANSRMSGWIAPLWIMALVGILLIPTEYRGGAGTLHSHALFQLLLDASDGQVAHTHSHVTPRSYATDWLDPQILDPASSQERVRPDVGQQQERVSAVSIITFVLLLPHVLMIPSALPRVSPTPRRLVGMTLRVLSPPPRAAVVAA